MAHDEEERMIAEEMEEQESCYHGFGECIDPDCRDMESCLGCELLYGEDT